MYKNNTLKKVDDLLDDLILSSIRSINERDAGGRLYSFEWGKMSALIEVRKQILRLDHKLDIDDGVVENTFALTKGV